MGIVVDPHDGGRKALAVLQDADVLAKQEGNLTVLGKDGGHIAARGAFVEREKLGDQGLGDPFTERLAAALKDTAHNVGQIADKAFVDKKVQQAGSASIVCFRQFSLSANVFFKYG